MSFIDQEQNFFGRTPILNLLKRRVIDLKEGYRQNVALLGNKCVGKSAILQKFISDLDDPDVTTIYLDLQNKEFNYFFSKFVGSLLYYFSKSKNLPLYDDLNLFLESTKKFIPQTIEVIKRIQMDINGGKPLDAFHGLLILPEIYTNETGKFCILILDEFHDLEEFVSPTAFQDLGKKIMTQKRCFYIFSSSYPGLAKKILSEKLSLLFGNFEVVMVDAFDLQTSQEFIDHNLKGIKLGTQLRNFLTDFTGGHPLYLNLICQELFNLSAVHKQSEIYMPLLSQAVENTIFSRWGVIGRHFELVINELCGGKGNRLTASVLIALSNGKHKMDELCEEICEELGVKKNLLKQRMNHLLELGVVAKNNSAYYFNDKLFKYWIKYVYQKRLKDVEFLPDKLRKQFKEEFHQGVENFQAVSRQDFSSRIMELLSCFDNEAFDLNGRKYKLPLFQEIVPLRIKNKEGLQVDVIKAMSSDAVWFIVPKRDSFGENDVNAVLSEVKKTGEKPDRFLIISLTDLDENTRLKALQERFWIWNEGELNTLLTLFDKPFILR
ncbi:MAG TPA: hypothetical protein DD723_03980 [Candidatus Omnitrophica bacterium]|nr:MAG: hypothetical protein A2Z81_00320 [Omnitrophica WOR_2 bacterium GWA2_45_18]OGX19637.1 MAG: hypothetical protein A2Y04_02865 [Omnitrophica WOR_2 bacterium GWC2_45_7]HBR14689.1 hypothetical protein [Candidatus Omnitrophota bacterium]